MDVCPVCHQPTLPQYYFCPNCGANLHPVPLSTTAGAQASLYAFSIILPVLCFLFINKWKGWKYYRSPDPKAKQIGTTALILIILSTVITFYFAAVWTEGFIQSSIASVNSDMGGYGY